MRSWNETLRLKLKRSKQKNPSERGRVLELKAGGAAKITNTNKTWRIIGEIFLNELLTFRIPPLSIRPGGLPRSGCTITLFSRPIEYHAPVTTPI